MPLFHQRVLEKHLKHIPAIDPRHAETLGKWAENLERSIYDSETQNDGEFIQRILIDVLGYVGSSDGAQWTVAKNQPVGKGNVDVALGAFTADSATILAPLELKGAKTRDLDAIMAGRNKTPVQQAWEYAMDAKGAQWVLVSNYREIRLYAVGYGRKDYEAFDLANLIKPENYARFILLLSAQNLLDGKTLSLLKESEQAEKDITDDLYKDYKALRANLIKTIGKDNPDKDPLDIIRYTQTILDRILFVAFAEDKGLLPDKTLEKAFETVNPFNPTPVWENFKGLFHAINKGNAALNIPGYNGGLFADDPALHSLNISDELCEGFKKIGEYDFDSEISVNILGHIFEQSITDLEELKAEAEGDTSAFDKKKGKRKKDGIFYTPPYITRYIVEQAVGGWLADRRKEIGFDTLPVLSDVDFESIKITGKRKIKHERNKNIAAHIAAWEAYKAALSQIKVLDPACGSGAFLNEVFDYLKNEGQTINNELARLTGDQTDLFRWDTHILANNIYGVDLNRESVEITKLSLWLKTANRNEKLTYLENNIKVGNSLIDDPAIAGDLAFDWHTEFAEIMDAGGFDVVVGNPPYGVSFSEQEKESFKKRFLYVPDFEIYYYFISQGLEKLRSESGYLSYIFPNTFLANLFAEKYRTWLCENYTVHALTNLSEVDVFADASVRTCILSVKKVAPLAEAKTYLADFTQPNLSDLNTSFIDRQSLLQNISNWMGMFKSNDEASSILEKIKKHPLLNEYCDVSQGLIPYDKYRGHDEDTIKNRIWHSPTKKDDTYRKELKGGDVTRYGLQWNGALWISYGTWLAAPRKPEFFTSPRILIREIAADRLYATYTEDEYYNTPSIINSVAKSESTDLFYILGIVNSKLISWWYVSCSPKAKKGLFPKILVNDVRNIPIANAETSYPIGQSAKKMLCLTDELNSISNALHALVSAETAIEKITKKLILWYELDVQSFLKEISNKSRPLSLAQKSEWMQHFEAEKAKALALKAEIDRLDAEIDQMVYALYGLTPDEIAIVEG